MLAQNEIDELIGADLGLEEAIYAQTKKDAIIKILRLYAEVYRKNYIFQNNYVDRFYIEDILRLIARKWNKLSTYKKISIFELCLKFDAKWKTSIVDDERLKQRAIDGNI